MRKLDSLLLWLLSSLLLSYIYNVFIIIIIILFVAKNCLFWNYFPRACYISLSFLGPYGSNISFSCSFAVSLFTFPSRVKHLRINIILFCKLFRQPVGPVVGSDDGKLWKAQWQALHFFEISLCISWANAPERQSFHWKTLHELNL